MRCFLSGGQLLTISYSVLVFLRHLRFWSKAHGEVLRYSTLRQKLRHEDEPLVAGIVLIVLPAAGGQSQHGVLLAEGYTVKFQPVLLCHLLKEVCQLLTRGVGSDVIKVNIRDEAGRDLENHILALHRKVDIRVLLHIVRIHIPMELRELWPVRVTVAGGVTKDDGIPVQLAPAAQTVVTVGVVAAPFAVVSVLVLLQVFGFDARFMLDALTQFEKQDMVTMRLTGSLGAISLVAGNSSAIVLPVRLKEEQKAA